MLSAFYKTSGMRVKLRFTASHLFCKQSVSWVNTRCQEDEGVSVLWTTERRSICLVPSLLTDIINLFHTCCVLGSSQ